VKLTKPLKAVLRLLAALAVLAAVPAAAQPTSLLGQDSVQKVDLLVVVTHADDDTAISPYLARAVLDQGKSAAVLHVGSSSSGFHTFGRERKRGLGLVRQVEARRALARLGIDQVWFLGGNDVFHYSPLPCLASLEHGRTLEEVVRLVRLTRPEIVLTWLPNLAVGQNHGGHQAAGVLATEAFDAAGDPTSFPAQLVEDGLAAWQPKKLYYFTDAFTTDFLAGKGPSYSIMTVSPARGQTYLRLAVEETLAYRSQYFPWWMETIQRGNVDEIEKMMLGGDWPFYVEPLRLMRAKSLVGGKLDGDLFEQIGVEPIAFAPLPAAAAEREPAVEIGPPWSFYRRFYRRHSIEPLAATPPPTLVVPLSKPFAVPILLRNPGAAEQIVELSLGPLPAGFTEVPGARSFRVPPRTSTSIELKVTAPGKASWTPVSLTVDAKEQGRVVLLVAVSDYTTAP